MPLYASLVYIYLMSFMKLSDLSPFIDCIESSALRESVNITTPACRFSCSTHNRAIVIAANSAR